MSTSRTLFVLLSTLSVAACSEPSDNVAASSVAEEKRVVEVVDPAGAAIGTIEVLQDANGSTLAVEVAGLEEGLRGVHLHETGRCEGPSFETAGGHWNPSAKEHGRDNPAGAHAGDLSNLIVDSEGHGSATYLVGGILMEGTEIRMADEDGTALVIHAGPDDYRTDPSGDSGARVACAVLAPPA